MCLLVLADEKKPFGEGNTKKFLRHYFLVLLAKHLKCKNHIFFSSEQYSLYVSDATEARFYLQPCQRKKAILTRLAVSFSSYTEVPISLRTSGVCLLLFCLVLSSWWQCWLFCYLQ